jgi:hypothetical protein
MPQKVNIRSFMQFHRAPFNIGPVTSQNSFDSPYECVGAKLFLTGAHEAPMFGPVAQLG